MNNVSTAMNNKQRKRLYSWSRPTREMRSRGKQSSLLHSEIEIRGEATIALHPSGDWFQGNIISALEDAYTIHGRRNHADIEYKEERLAVVPEDAVEDLVGSLHNSLEISGASFESSTSCSPTSHDDEVSTCGSLDSAVVLATMERLGLEMDTFTVHITDYETGIEHTLKDVSITMEDEDLRMFNDSLTFNSSDVVKGNKADVVITTKIGPNLVEKGLLVFRGDLRMTYRDEPCFPVSLDASQWCL